MTHDNLTTLFKNHNSFRIIRADTAPLILSFLNQVFKEDNKSSIREQQLTIQLEDFLIGLKKDNESQYSKAAKEYLKDWADKGFVYRRFEIDDEPLYELTPGTANALRWIEELDKQEFVGTASRLLQFFTILKELVTKTNTNIYERVKELEKQKRKIELEIEKAKQGDIEKLDDTQVKESYFLAEETARRLLSDFRQVEQNFRDLDSEFRIKIITSNRPKGKVLDDLFGQQDYLKQTDQGRSFKAFWEFLMSHQMQDELDVLLEKVLNLPQVKALQEEWGIHRIKNNLMDAGEKVNRTTDSLIEQLRKFLELKSFQENKRIHENLERLERLLLTNKELIPKEEIALTIDGIVDLNFFMNRTLHKPVQKVKFDTNIPVKGEGNADTSKLFEQFSIDREVLKQRIQSFLKSQSQVSLKAVTDEFAIEKGVSELVAYLDIAEKKFKTTINQSVQEEIRIRNEESGYESIAELPQIIIRK